MGLILRILKRINSHSRRLYHLLLSPFGFKREKERGFEENSSLTMVAEYYSGGGVPPSNHHHHHHHHKDVRLHLALFAIQCVCAIYNTLCQLFLSKNDESKDDWRAVLVFSLYRDVLAAPLLYVCAFLHDSHQQHVSGGVSSNFRWFPSSQDFPRVLSQAFLGIFLQPTRIFTRDSTRRSSYGVSSTSGDTDVCDGDRGVFRTREVERVHSERSGGGVRRRDEYERD